jgi:hypothetical protein
MSTPVKLMRQSTINNAQICQRRIMYDLDPSIPYYSSIVRAMGTALHSAHEKYYRARMEGGPLVADVDLLVRATADSLEVELDRSGKNFNWMYQPATTKKDERVLTKAEALEMMAGTIRYYHAAKCYWPAGFEVLAVEVTFNFEWEGHPGWIRHGTSDLIIQGPNGFVWCVDHKHSLSKPQKDKYAAYKTPQASYYLHHLDEMPGLIHPDTPRGFCYDVTLLNAAEVVAAKPEAEVFFRRQEVRTAGQLAATMTQAGELADLIDAGGPFLPSPDSFLCSAAYCDYWDRCPFGAAFHN